jgi:diguanylate cyclase (GGDEF)-like protein/PAS domain S-box-containing protein
VDGGWHPEDALFAPLYAASGELVGVLSVDLPRDGRRPGALQRELLEMFAAQAGIAIDNARLTADLRREHALLQASQESLNLAFEGSDVGMAFIDLDPEHAGRFLRANQAMSQLTGFPVEQLEARRFVDLLHPHDVEEGLAALRRLVEGDLDVYRGDKRYLHADGGVVWVSVTCSVVRDSEGVTVYGFSQMQDVTERHENEQRLAEAAIRDPLTGLLNRSGLDRRLQELLRDPLAGDRRGAVLFCDLDGMKAVNDDFGHDAGDAVLRATGARLSAAVRQGDAVARLGGDEFVILVQDTESAGLAVLAERVRRSLARPTPHEGQDLHVTVSIGISALDGERTAAAVLRSADTAMYAAKRGGRDRFAFAG